MTAQHRRDHQDTGRPGRRLRLPALFAIAALLVSTAIFGATAPDAAAADRAATITLTGVTSNTYPTGGNTVWVQPGTSLTLKEAPINVAGNAGALAVLSNVVGSLLGLVKPTIVDLKANLNLASVQRGNVSLSGNQTVTTPNLAKGVYKFTWTFTAVTSGLLGTKSVNLDANQLAGLGIKFNASNTYFGYIVSDTKSPCAGATCISLQTPRLSVAPSVPVVGQLPTITVPGQTINVPIPSIPGVNAPLPGTSGSGSGTPTTGGTTPGGTGSTPGSTGSSSPTNPYGYNAPGCTGPCAVVPKGGGGGGSVGSAYGVTLGDLGDPAGAAGAIAGTGSDADGAAAVAAGGSALGNGDGQLAVDNAFDGTRSGTTVPGLPTTLTIVAIAAFVAAAGLWFARRRARV